MLLTWFVIYLLVLPVVALVVGATLKGGRSIRSDERSGLPLPLPDGSRSTGPR